MEQCLVKDLKIIILELAPNDIKDIFKLKDLVR
jgi:hypothetical protein